MKLQTQKGYQRWWLFSFFRQLHEKACFKAFCVLDDNFIDFIAKTRHRRSQTALR
nr:MAG TPA: hypothetical protein [Caudoviricetes sp.]